MNADLVPLALLTVATALSWPEFASMFRVSGGRSTAEFSVMSAASAAFLGAVGLAMQQFGPVHGGIASLVGIFAGHWLRKDSATARAGALLSVACVAVLFGSAV